jgi:type I restriction enzyme S subunit
MPHVENGIPVITAKNIIDGRIDFSNVHYTTEAAFKSLSKKDLPQQGEILLTKDGSIGRAAVVRTAVPFCVNQSVAVIRFGSDAMSSEYLLRVIEAPFTQIMIDEAARGSAIRHIAITSFGRLPVPVPPFEEQVEIARRVGKLLSLSAALMEQVDNIAKTIERSSQAVLAKAFRGGLTGFEAVLAS